MIDLINQLPIKIIYNGGLIVVYSQDKIDTSKGYFIVFDSNLNQKTEIPCNFIPSISASDLSVPF